jgi:hypothetical protein
VIVPLAMFVGSVLADIVLETVPLFDELKDLLAVGTLMVVMMAGPNTQ